MATKLQRIGSSRHARKKTSSPTAGVAVSLILLLFILIEALGAFGAGIRLELVSKILLLIALLHFFCHIKLRRNLEVTVVLLAVVLVFATTGFDIESKGFSRIAISIFALSSVLLPMRTSRIVIVALVSLAVLQPFLNSRTLLVVIALTTLQYFFVFFDKKLLLTKSSPIALSVMLIYIGYAFISHVNLVHASVSNLARSTMLAAALDGVLKRPFGFSSLESYQAHLRSAALQISDSDYNDPHNVFFTALAWGGFPLLILLYYSFVKFISNALRHSPRASLVQCFWFAVFAIYMSISTLSLSNFVFLILVAFMASKSVRTASC